jgi:predicted transcriptional regulator of viral defense system
MRPANFMHGNFEMGGCGFFILHVCSGILNMRAVATPPDFDQLFAIAESQEGYFTMAQALESGYVRSTHSYHVKAGNWLREHRGIYRLRQYPQTENGHLVLWSLWSRDIHGMPQGVYSHTSALSLRDLSDANPSKLHMTVPPSFRRNSETPAVLELHKARLEAQEVIRERGYALTTVMRAIFDCAESGDADVDMLKQATQEGLRRGLITRAEIKVANTRMNAGSMLKQILQKF